MIVLSALQVHIVELWPELNTFTRSRKILTYGLIS